MHERSDLGADRRCRRFRHRSPPSRNGITGMSDLIEPPPLVSVEVSGLSAGYRLLDTVEAPRQAAPHGVALELVGRDHTHRTL
jgi:hypothetical protein